MVNHVHHDSALAVLAQTPDETIDLIYIDPPFGIGRDQVSSRAKSDATYTRMKYADPSDDYVVWLTTHVRELKRVLKKNGTIYVHLDYHWVHYAKVMMDVEFGVDNFLNEIVVSYNFGGRGKKCWPKKHDTILMYVKDHKDYVFNYDDIDRIPYKAPEMQKVGRSPEDAAIRIAAGQVPTDVWDIGIVGTNAKERNGYPTQKPMKLLERIILASSPSDGVVMDVFGGSGTTGEAAHKHGRNFVLVDQSPWSIEVMTDRFKNIDVVWHV